jgi:hypothetical protein
MIHAVAVNRPAYLIRARGADGARVEMEINASLLKGQPHEIKQTADLHICICD